ncbi:MAG: bifunctional demethylmenaquinone methyltransferase/2-methoxy-6-polyprenyl-1,4-benzoquinol methylase UbiE [Nitrospinae bacterium]|nr:bifunctional demethylmenaquinone methyltransferase/2-methoxy-6-polyprenyl-1,4-benzoquinol methylase UbiE [Nitrospinota bacterium]
MNKSHADFSRQIQNMFGAIAPKYDFLNRALSCGRDRYWRRKAVDALAPRPGDRCLDIATGTADVALEIASRDPGNIRVVGVDFSSQMLELGSRKVRARNMERSIALQQGMAESLAFANGSFHGIVTAFGIRNFSDREKGLKEMWRVLKSKGRVVILEFSLPANPVLGLLYRLYFERLLPWIGRRVSGHRSAYSYLPRSVGEFPGPREFVLMMKKTGFQDVAYRNLTFGIATVYTGFKYAS